MDLNAEIWNAIDTSVKMPEESKKALHISIMRLVEQSKTRVGQKHGVTIMTQEASKAGDKDSLPSAARPKTI